MTYIDKIHRATPAGRRTVSAEPAVPKRVLEALHGALGADGDLKPKLHKKTSSSDAASAGAGRNGAHPPDVLDDYSLPPKPAPAQIDQLTKNVLAEIERDSGLSAGFPSVLDPTTLTPLQRWLFTIVNGMSKEELERHPKLLAAVRAGFATEGGQQLALAMNLLDADLVGDLSHPSRRRLLEGNSLIQPQTLAQIIFDIDPALPASVLQAATAWIATAQGTAAGRAMLNALCNGPPIRIRIAGSANTAASASGRTLHVDPSATELPQQVHDGLNQLAAEAPAGAVTGAAMDPSALVDEALAFDSNVPPEVRETIIEIAKHSPTFRNMLLRSLKEHGQITIDLDDLGGGADFTHEVREIRLDEGLSLEEMASAVVFEVGNAAQSPLLRAAATAEPTAAAAARFHTWAAMLQMRRMELSSIEALDFIQWVGSNRPTPRRAGESQAQYESRLMRDWDLVSSYLEDKHGRDVAVRSAYRALMHEAQESNTMLLASQVSSEVKAGVEAEEARLGRPHPVLTAKVRAELGEYNYLVEPFEDSGNFILNYLKTEVQSGHTVGYFTHALDWESFDRTALPGRPAAAATDAALTEAGADAGENTQAAARAAAARHGSGNPGAIEDAAHASALEQSNALAARLLDHPEIARFLGSLGESFTGAARVAIVYALGAAIYTDVKNGDKHAPATRKALAELLGGLAGAELGALGGSGAGAALGGLLGSVIPGVGNAVGAFIGGIVGGLGGSIGGWIGGSAAADEAFKLTKGPIDHLIDHLTGDTRPPVKPAERPVERIPQAQDSPKNLALAERIIKLGSENDAWANTDELRKGLEAAGYNTEHISDEQLDLLISAYNIDGNGAMSAQQIVKAIEDGALVFVGKDVGVDVTAALGNDEAPINVAQRVLRHGSEDDAWANRGELEDGFKSAGFDITASKEEVDRLIATYGASGNGALTGEELAQAIEDGVVVLGEDGTVRIDSRALAAAKANASPPPPPPGPPPGPPLTSPPHGRFGPPPRYRHY